MKKLKIYISQDDPKNVNALNPMVKPWAEGLGFGPQEGEWAKRGKEFYERVERIEDADICVCLHEWYEDRNKNDWYPGGDNTNTLELAKAAGKLGKQAVLIFHADYEGPIPVENVVLLRTSLVASKQQDHEILFAGMVGDRLEENGITWTAKPKRNRPTVGFCGNVDNFAGQKRLLKRITKAIGYIMVRRPRIERFLRRLGIQLTKHHGRRIRHQLLHLLGKSRRVDANFLIRDFYGNGCLEPELKDNEEHLRQSREEFCKNVLESDYTLCARGSGNYSYRFYETLSLGRIPLFVNTDCRLPFDDVVDWKKEVLWVEEEDVCSIGKRVKAFHDSLTPEEFEAKQKRCRELWEEYCSEFGFFSKLADVLRKQIGTDDA